MQQYKDLIEQILDYGEDSDDRTGDGTRFIWGSQMRFDLSQGFPITTLRFAPFRFVFEETMFFLRGHSNTLKLEDKNVNIWKYHTSREYLDSQKLYDLPEGNMGKGYGHQIRYFNGDKMRGDKGVDQLEHLLRGLKNKPSSRRQIITHWNPCQLNEAALVPCHILHQYKITNGRLDSLFYMRSSDFILAAGGFNVPQYALMNHLFAKMLGVQPGTLVYMAGDTHIYQSHIEGARELIQRDPLPLPKLQINKTLNSIQDLHDLTYDDVNLINYQHYGKMNFDLTG